MAGEDEDDEWNEQDGLHAVEVSSDARHLRLGGGDGEDDDGDLAPHRTETIRGGGRLYSQILRRSSGGNFENCG